MDMHNTERGAVRGLFLLLAAALCLTGTAYAQEGPLKFDLAEKAMLAANPQAAAALRDLEAAKLRVTSARAGLYPYFSANASYSRNGAQGTPAYDSYSYGLSGRQQLLFPLRPGGTPLGPGLPALRRGGL